MKLKKTYDTNTLNKMIDVIKKSAPIYHPSFFWEHLNKVNIRQLNDKGYRNFKRTVNQNYFNWIPMKPNRQFMAIFLKWLQAPTPKVFFSEFDGEILLETSWQKFKCTRRQRFFYKLYVSMLWEYVRKLDSENILEKLEEPLEGNPLKITYKEKLISQDLCNSVLEYYSIRNNVPSFERERLTIAELGAGYGRDAFIFLKATKCKYVIFDIPPALYIAEKYLSNVFPKLKIFKFRDFKNYSKIKSEYEKADVCFFTPNQMELLPEKQFDIFINISSLQEMTLEQIKHYFRLIDKYCKGYFYTKQWITWKNPQDNITVSYSDYPIPSNWKQTFFRKHPIQTKFFEALYKIE